MGSDELSQLHLGHTPISYDEVTGTGRNRIPFATGADRACHRLCGRGGRCGGAALAGAAAAAALQFARWRCTSSSSAGCCRC